MKIRRSCKLIYLLCLFCSAALGQINSFSYKRELSGIKHSWHKIVLPDQVYGKLATDDFSDIRIYGITINKDTVQAPYMLLIKQEKEIARSINFKQINQSKNTNGHYFTFELADTISINQLQLEFKQSNFDWHVTLEGSQDLKEWFLITADYRILAIQNADTTFRFTAINFPDSRYRYLRLCIKSDISPNLITAKVVSNAFTAGSFNNYVINNIKCVHEKKSKQSVIDITLNSAVPVSYLKLYIRKGIDYNRFVAIKYLSDSVKTEKGWLYSYNTLTTGIISSSTQNEFHFVGTVARQLRIVIENHDNEPLVTDSLAVKGYVHELIVRFNKEASYYLVYGNEQAAKTNYDLSNFADKIPASIAELELGKEEPIRKEANPKVGFIFENKYILWAIIITIIALLAYFSLTMLRKK